MKKAISFIMAFALMLSINIFPAAATESRDNTRASIYFEVCTACISERSNGDLRIYFDVTAKSTMTTLGATTIYLYCNGSIVKTYTYRSCPEMRTSNTDIHSDYVTYSDTESGSEYYAYVTFYAKNSSGSESKPVYTDSIYT